MAATVWTRAVPLILVVDDDDDIREMIAETLVLDGYRVSTAPNGSVALEQAHVNRPDLIVLDLMMPVMNGWQFLEAQREDPELVTVPVVVVTASSYHAEGAAVPGGLREQPVTRCTRHLVHDGQAFTDQTIE